MGRKPDIYKMDKKQLENYLAELKNQLALHDVSEPLDMESEEYDAWGDKREAIEDLIDDVLDLLEEQEA